jgi:hypothetical protein
MSARHFAFAGIANFSDAQFANDVAHQLPFIHVRSLKQRRPQMAKMGLSALQAQNRDWQTFIDVAGLERLTTRLGNQTSKLAGSFSGVQAFLLQKISVHAR